MVISSILLVFMFEMLRI